MAIDPWPEWQFFARDAVYSGFTIEMEECHRRGSAGAPDERPSAHVGTHRAASTRHWRHRRSARSRPHPRQDTSAFAVQHAAAERNAHLHQAPIPQLPSHVDRRSRAVSPIVVFVAAVALIVIAIVLAVLA